VEITVKLGQSDYIYGYLWAYYLGSENRPTIVGLAMMLLLTLLGVQWLYRISPARFRLPYLIGPITAVAVVACLPFYTCWRAWASFRQRRWLRQPTNYTFNSRGISSRAVSYSGFREWGYIRRVEENGRAFLIYLSPAQVVVIPKRYFESEDQIRAFRELAAQHCTRVSLLDT